MLLLFPSRHTILSTLIFCLISSPKANSYPLPLSLIKLRFALLAAAINRWLMSLLMGCRKSYLTIEQLSDVKTEPMDSSEDTIQNPGGLTLYYQWQRISEPRGVILIVHGICEHIGRYRKLENWFCEQGFTSYGFDQRGHGRSTGRRTHVADFSDYVSDLRLITGLVQEREPGLPLFLYAHSMGAVVALLGVLRNPTGYKGLIIASPAMAIGSTFPDWMVKTGDVLAKFLPTLKVPSLIKTVDLSRDPEIIAAYERDTLVEKTVTLGWLAGILAAQKEILRAAPEIVVPVLLLHSRADAVAAIIGTHRLVERLPQNKVTLHEYAHLSHELHNAPRTERSAVLNDIGDWLNRHLTI